MTTQNKITKRNKTTFEESTNHCESCGWVMSHKHHMLEFSKYGENDATIFICPNCHWLLHICVSALLRKDKRAYKKWNYLLRTLGDNHQLILWAKKKMKETSDKELYEDIEKHLEDA